MKLDSSENTIRLLDDKNNVVFSFELEKLYELWIPGETEEYEYLHVTRSATSPEYAIVVMTTASGQGGIVAVVDIASGEIVHYHEGAFALFAEIYKGYVVTIYGVQCWGTPYYNCVDVVKFGTKENTSGERLIKVDRKIEEIVAYEISNDVVRLKDNLGKTVTVRMADLIGE